MPTSNEVTDSWFRNERVMGAAFMLNETVRVVAGEHAGLGGSVISLLELEPDALYLVELSSGTDAQIEQRNLLSLSAFDDSIALAKLQRWYAAQCDGDWEHSYGVKIETLDNPGWLLTIDLDDTPLETRPFTKIDATDGPDWHTCEVDAKKFKAACAPGMLARVMRIFHDWQSQSPEAA